MHVILGAGGSIANALTPLLVADHHSVRLVSRRPVVHPSARVDWQQADLLDAQAVERATVGATTIYLCAGLTYDAGIWEEQWPVIMKNVIEAARRTGAHLLFFDNVYMYGPTTRAMTENTPYRPVSRKGTVRARIADQLQEAGAAGGLRTTVARAPDFYGSHSKTSLLDSMVLNKFAAGERALWVGDRGCRHSFIFVPDAARGLYTLASNPERAGGVWHLPTAPALTGHQLLERAATVYEVPDRSFALTKWMLRAAGLFDSTVRETVEMYYQYDRDYVFSSAKFEGAFGEFATGYTEGIRQYQRSAAS